MKYLSLVLLLLSINVSAFPSVKEVKVRTVEESKKREALCVEIFRSAIDMAIETAIDKGEHQIPTLFYSCNPTTFSRMMKELRGLGYNVEVSMYDFSTKKIDISWQYE